MTITNPPPVKIPPKILADPELRLFFRSLLQSNYFVWEGGGGASGVTPVANGGTGASTAADARTNLGVAIGSNVQAYDADLDTISTLAKTDGNFIVGNGTTWVPESGATARTSLGLGTTDAVQFANAQVSDAEIDGALNHDGTTVGFYGTTPVTQAAASTAAETTITHTAPGAADYAIQDLTDSSPFGFASQDEGNTVLQVIANLQTRVAELEAALNASTGVGITA